MRRHDRLAEPPRNSRRNEPQNNEWRSNWERWMARNHQADENQHRDNRQDPHRAIEARQVSANFPLCILGGTPFEKLSPRLDAHERATDRLYAEIRIVGKRGDVE